MGYIKNQDLNHFTIDGKRTACGLSNQYKTADNIQEFNEKLKDGSWDKHLCKKCKSKASI